MEHDWKKTTLIPEVAAKNRDAANLTRHFHGGSPSSQGGTTPKFNEIGNNFLYDLTKYMLLLIHWKSFEFSTWLTREMFIWPKNSTLGISNSEDFHYLHWRLVAGYPGHVTSYFRTQCQRPVHPKDLICDIWHSIKIKYPYTKPQSPTPFNSNSPLATFVRNCGAKPNYKRRFHGKSRMEIFHA